MYSSVAYYHVDVNDISYLGRSKGNTNIPSTPPAYQPYFPSLFSNCVRIPPDSPSTTTPHFFSIRFRKSFEISRDPIVRLSWIRSRSWKEVIRRRLARIFEQRQGIGDKLHVHRRYVSLHNYAGPSWNERPGNEKRVVLSKSIRESATNFVCA